MAAPGSRSGGVDRPATAFEVIPAIDLRGGLPVRLLHGDFDQETVVGDDPVALARRWQSIGATRLHVVDLEGSRDGAARNGEVIESILRAVTIPVQVTGGIRDEQTARRWLAAGAARIVLGTAAVRDPELVRRLASRDPDAVVVAVDARDGVVRTDGWTESSGIAVFDLVAAMEALGVRRFLYTDISRDGALTGPNVDAYREFGRRSAAAVIASGGVSSADDVLALAGCGAESVVVGRALYTGAVSLPAVLAMLAERGR